VAKPVTQITIGIDAAKDQLVASIWHNDTTSSICIDNEQRAIATWLRRFDGSVRIAIEPTSNYHLPVVEQAIALGFDVYLIDPRQLVHYREAVNVRNKTDPDDAYLLARYLTHEAAQLRPFQPQRPQARRLWALIKRRAVVVNCVKQLNQSFQNIAISTRALLTQFKLLLKRIDREIKQLIGVLGWNDHYQRCLSIPGIGPLNAAALTTLYHRGTFASVDAFIAFIGFDVQVRESGRFIGKRRLSKRGDPELRRLLYCAAKPARAFDHFALYHQRQLDKGLSKTAANVILARKLARIAFALISKQQSFDTAKYA